jgi:hypothetical protein
VIAAILKSDLDSYASDMHRANAMFAGAAEGRMTAEKVGYYLSNVRLLLQATPVHLERARLRALALGDHDLAGHFATKRVEERGHDRWAENDLKNLEEEKQVAPSNEYASGLLGLLHFLEATIDRDPATYLAHIAFAEYVIATRGGEWLALIEERCGIAMRMMTAVGNHVELDKDHADEGFEVIDRLVTNPAKLDAMRGVLHRVIGYFEEFSSQVMAFEAPCKTTSAA